MFYSIALHLHPLNNTRRRIIDIIPQWCHILFTQTGVFVHVGNVFRLGTITKLAHVQCLITHTSNTTRFRGKIRRLLTHNFTYLQSTHINILWSIWGMGSLPLWYKTSFKRPNHAAYWYFSKTRFLYENCITYKIQN